VTCGVDVETLAVSMAIHSVRIISDASSRSSLTSSSLKSSTCPVARRNSAAGSSPPGEFHRSI
jgi:hypothetical protein